jgi:hypothetical protein
MAARPILAVVGGEGSGGRGLGYEGWQVTDLRQKQGWRLTGIELPMTAGSGGGETAMTIGTRGQWHRLVVQEAEMNQHATLGGSSGIRGWAERANGDEVPVAGKEAWRNARCRPYGERFDSATTTQRW